MLSPGAWWPLYFPDEAYEAKDRRAELAEQLIAYFASDDGFDMVEQARAVARLRTSAH